MQKRNSEPYLSTYLHTKGVRLGLPISGSFELTARCNFRCPMCYVHLNQPDLSHRELTAQQWIDLARDARDSGMVFALLTGGEPFLRPDFFQIYQAMKDMGILVSINTNGSLLFGDTLNRLLEDPPFRVNISLYGGCAETYRQMCGQDAFAQVTDAIRALRQAGVDVRLNLSIIPANRPDVEKIYQISRELGVHVKGTAYMFPPIRTGKDLENDARLSAGEAAKATVEWDLLRLNPTEFAMRAQAMQQLKAIEPPECPVDGGEGIRCRAGRASFWLTWDGRMLPCGMFSAPVAFPLQAGFQSAWATILEETRNIRTPGQCTSCPKREVCSVCAASCLTETGHFDQVPAYLCQMTDTLINQTWQTYCSRKDDLDADQKTIGQA